MDNVRVEHPVFQKIDQDIKCLKTQAVDTALIEEASAATEGHDDTAAKKEEDIERKRNKSRLNPQHRNLLHEKMPYSEPMDWFHDTVKYKRKMYGRYGHASGVLPGILWPTREDLEEIKEYESVAYPYAIQELITRVKEKEREEQAALKARYIYIYILKQSSFKITGFLFLYACCVSNTNTVMQIFTVVAVVLSDIARLILMTVNETKINFIL